MNPLPNRPLLNNSAIPLSLPNVPSFDQIPYNGRPRKMLAEGGKDFPLMNGLNTLSLSAPMIPGSQNTLDRNPHAAGSQSNINLAGSSNQQPSPGLLSHGEKEKEADSDNRQITAIYRPDDAGEWKEKLRQSHEATELARFAKENQTGAHGWESRRDDDDLKDADTDIYDEEPSVLGEGEDTKIWKAKRTLRKLVV